MMLLKIFAVFIFYTLSNFSETDALISIKLPINDELRQALGYTEGSYLNYTEWTSSFGYHSEEHSATTDDGYILTFFRTNSPNCSENLKTYPVLLVHGLFSNSDTFLDPGVNASLVYLLADQCYDVWVANFRGNDYSRAHSTLDPDTDADFWRYSSDEFGYYDVPATIDYILNNTGVSKVNVIGYSMGGQSTINMCADRPSYNDKLNFFAGIAPCSRNLNIRSVTFSALIRVFNTFRTLLRTFGIEEVFAKGGIIQVVLEYICSRVDGLSPLILGLLDFYDPGSISTLTSRSVLSNFFVGASVQQLAKLGQDSLNQVYSHFSFGAVENEAKYGSEVAPAYNLSNVVVPTLLLTGLSDPIVPSENVVWLGQQLPNTVSVVELSDPHWNHLDNTHSQNIPAVQFSVLQEYLDRYNP